MTNVGDIRVFATEKERNDAVQQNLFPCTTFETEIPDGEIYNRGYCDAISDIMKAGKALRSGKNEKKKNRKRNDQDTTNRIRRPGQAISRSRLPVEGNGRRIEGNSGDQTGIGRNREGPFGTNGTSSHNDK